MVSPSFPRSHPPLRRAATSFTDEQLMAQVRAGADSAFTTLVERYLSRVVSEVVRYLGSREDAEDIAQETFVRLYTCRAKYRAIGRFSGWLFTIAANLARSELRRRQSAPPQQSLDSLRDSPDNADSSAVDAGAMTDRDAEHREIDHILDVAVSHLPRVYGEALVLRDRDELSYEEIGARLRVPGGTVRSRISRARRLMKWELSPFLSPSAGPCILQQAHRSGLLVLVVDDDPITRSFMAAALRMDGISVVEAEDAPSALKAARGSERYIDALVTDIVMPGDNGVALALRLRRFLPELEVMFVSAYVEGALDSPRSSVHESTFLRKPFTAEVLRGALATMLELREERRVAANLP
jgi:RNA polymerase sigma-70 factor (ECF subfamily)